MPVLTPICPDYCADKLAPGNYERWNTIYRGSVLFMDNGSPTLVWELPYQDGCCLLTGLISVIQGATTITEGASPDITVTRHKTVRVVATLPAVTGTSEQVFISYTDSCGNLHAYQTHLRFAEPVCPATIFYPQTKLCGYYSTYICGYDPCTFECGDIRFIVNGEEFGIMNKTTGFTMTTGATQYGYLQAASSLDPVTGRLEFIVQPGFSCDTVVEVEIFGTIVPLSSCTGDICIPAAPCPLPLPPFMTFTIPNNRECSPASGIPFLRPLTTTFIQTIPVGFSGSLTGQVQLRGECCQPNPSLFPPRVFTGSGTTTLPGASILPLHPALNPIPYNGTTTNIGWQLTNIQAAELANIGECNTFEMTYTLNTNQCPASPTPALTKRVDIHHIFVIIP